MVEILKRLVLIAIFILLPATASGDEPKLSISASPTSGSMQDDFVMSVTIEGQGNGTIPKLSGGEDFKLSLIGPETRIEIINGSMRSSQSYRYRIIPLKEGKLLTPSAEIVIDGRKLQASPVEITVTKGSGDSNLSGQDVFLRQEISPQTAYVGQQLVNNILLYSRIKIFGSKFDDLSYEGFWNETLGQEQGEQFSQRIGNDNYRVLRLRKAIFPLKAGTINIPKRTISASIQLRAKQRQRNPFWDSNPFSNNLFEDFFDQGRLQEVEIDSNPLPVPVVALPAPPSDLPLLGLKDPLVGSTSISLAVQSGDIELGASKTLDVTITTEGLINPLKTLPLNFGPLIKAYPEAPQTTSFELGGKLQTKRRFRFSLVAASPGAIDFPGIRLGWFDPSTETYKIASTQSFAFEITAPETPNPSSAPAVSFDSTVMAPSPLPSASLKPYAPQSAWEQYRENFGAGTLLIIIAALGSLCLLACLAKYWSTEFSGQKSALRSVLEAQTLPELKTAVINFLAEKTIPGANSLSTEELKASIRKAVTNNDIAYSLQLFFDEADLLTYGKSRTQPTKEELEKTKEAVAKALNSLP